MQNAELAHKRSKEINFVWKAVRQILYYACCRLQCLNAMFSEPSPILKAHVRARGHIHTSLFI
jgi:hypothetical protein